MLPPLEPSTPALSPCGYFRYNIRREKGLLRDAKTSAVGPSREHLRYTELADEMVERLGRLGQKVQKVGLEAWTAVPSRKWVFLAIIPLQQSIHVFG